MKLAIGQNIRDFRKKNNLTQETLADRLGVSYQSISRWENDTTYPYLELIPAIAEILAVTVDQLLGMPQIEKEKRAVETFDELRRECMKRDYDVDKIVNLLRDIRRNYLDSKSAWRPWVEGNGRAFRDPKILPEVRLMAELFLERQPMNPHVLETMAEIEDEEHLQDFLKKYTTSFDCSERALLFNRYLRLGDDKNFEAERRYQLFRAIDTIFSHRHLVKRHASAEYIHFANEFLEKLLTLIRCDAVDDNVDMWITFRLEQMTNSAARYVSLGKFDEAILKLEAVAELLEQTMKITKKIILPVACRFLEGMEWYAQEEWITIDNNPDSLKERCVFIETIMGNGATCHCLFPSQYFDELNGKDFEPLRNHPEFENLCERVKALIITKPNEK